MQVFYLTFIIYCQYNVYSHKKYVVEHIIKHKHYSLGKATFLADQPLKLLNTDWCDTMLNTWCTSPIPPMNKFPLEVGKYSVLQ